MCEEACPCDAIELTPHYEVTGTSRAELIFDKTKLLRVFDETVGEKPM
jgi:NADH-quinone oxidoreductase subunit I